MKLDRSIFKAYDIRGVYPESLNEEVAERVGRAYAVILKRENPGKKLTVVVSRDMRLSSESLGRSLVEGLIKSGLDVVDIGLATTPTFYFGVAYYGYDGGVQVSASHNPKEYNGFKLVRARAVPVSGERGIYEIRDLVEKGEFAVVKEEGEVSFKKGVVEEEVRVQVKDWRVNLDKIEPMKIVVDAANAMGSLDIEVMFEGLPIELVKLNFELDGSFPVHQPDPFQPENLKWAQEAVVAHKADLGIIPDGDGDRYFFIDEKGEEVRQEILRGIMAQLVLEDYPGATVCYDIRPGRITRDMIEEAGGVPVVTRVGHSLIKEKMLEVGAVYGGESSGHYFYKFPYGTFEAPVVQVGKFLEWLSGQGKPLSEAVAPYEKYFHSGEINSEVEDKEAKIRELAKKYSDGEISYLDGITVEYGDWWFNVRPSNTENKLRLNLEAKSRELMEKRRDEVLRVIRS